MDALEGSGIDDEALATKAQEQLNEYNELVAYLEAHGNGGGTPLRRAASSDDDDPDICDDNTDDASESSGTPVKAGKHVMSRGIQVRAQ
jgi:hypothetical protein